MAARFTVVFDDEALYRTAKVRAAETGVPLKTLVEAALKSYLLGGAGAAEESTDEPIQWDWGAYDEWQREVESLGEELGDDTPADLSDVKHQLYGFPKRTMRMLAEEREPFGRP